MSAGRTGAGVAIVGTGSALPGTILTNADLEQVMDTSDEWIVQRTGIRSRHIASKDETTLALSVRSLRKALDDANLKPEDLDLVILASITCEMTCPPTSCRIVHEIGCGQIGALDMSAACCGFVFSLNAAHAMVASGQHRTVALVGTDTITRHVRYTTSGRGTAILFGDASGTLILQASDDPTRGMIASEMHTDGGRWGELYLPTDLERDTPPGVEASPDHLNMIQMNGRAVFKFAVGKFSQVIQQTLDRAGLRADDVDMYVCHQSNARIISAARERFGLSEDKVYVNIDRVGNTVSASVPVCLDELRSSGRVREGQRIMFVAFGGGLTWGASLWQL